MDVSSLLAWRCRAARRAAAQVLAAGDAHQAAERDAARQRLLDAARRPRWATETTEPLATLAEAPLMTRAGERRAGGRG